MTDYVSDPMTEGSTTTTTIEKTITIKGQPVKRSEEHSQSKKPRLSGNKALEEFHEAFTNLHNWLQIMEKSVDKCKNKLESDKEKMEDKYKVVNEITNEIDCQKGEIDNFEEICKKLFNNTKG